MGISGHTSVSMNQQRFNKMHPKFSKHIQVDNSPSYTAWITDLAENGISRVIELKSLFPNLSVIKILNHGLVIEDLKNDNVVKVIMKGKKITCSDSGSNFEDYVLYATLHPSFRV